MPKKLSLTKVAAKPARGVAPLLADVPAKLAAMATTHRQFLRGRASKVGGVTPCAPSVFSPKRRARE